MYTWNDLQLILLIQFGVILIKANRLAEAEKIYRSLIQRNPENHLYYHQLEVATNSTTIEAKLALYAEMSEKYPKAQSPQRLSLDIAENDTFRAMTDKYMRKALRKGVPPLFVDLRPLYADQAKMGIIEELCQGYYENLKSSRRSFDPDTSDTSEAEPATALLWLLYYLAQHHDHKKEFQKAQAKM